MEHVIKMYDFPIQAPPGSEAPAEKPVSVRASTLLPKEVQDEKIRLAKEKRSRKATKRISKIWDSNLAQATKTEIDNEILYMLSQNVEVLEDCRPKSLSAEANKGDCRPQSVLITGGNFVPFAVVEEKQKDRS